MKNQKKMMIVLLILLLFFAAIYMGVRAYNEKMAKEAEGEEITITDFEVSDVTQFSYTANGVVYSYTKEGDEWLWDGDTTMDIDELALKPLLYAMVYVTADEELTEYGSLSDYGLDEPSLVITITTAEGTTTIDVGSKNDFSGTYYLKYSNRDSIFLVTGNFGTMFSLLPENMAVNTDTTEAVIVE